MNEKRPDPTEDIRNKRMVSLLISLPIGDEASVSSARQRIREASQRLNLGNELIESVALIGSELTHNQLRHAKQGYFAVKPVERQGVKGLEVIAADIGPGIAKPNLAIKDIDELRTVVKNLVLLRRENVVVTPHIAFNGTEALERILLTTIQNI